MTINDVNYHLRYKNQLNKNCNKCDKIVKLRNRITWGFGNTKAKIMFVGQSPGRFGCEITGIPFTRDMSGMLFQRMLKGINLDFKKDCYITNVVKCCPKEYLKNMFVNRTPTDKEISNCSSYLKREIEFVNPNLVVAVGSIAKYTIRDLNIKDGNEILFKHVFHPGYILRQPSMMTEYREQFRIVKKKYLRCVNDFKYQRRLNDYNGKKLK